MHANQKKVSFAGFLFIHREGTFCELTLFKNKNDKNPTSTTRDFLLRNFALIWKRRNSTQILTSSLAGRAESLEPSAPMTRFISCEIVELKLEDRGAQPGFRVVTIRTFKTRGEEPAYGGSDLICPSGACVSVRSFHADVVPPWTLSPVRVASHLSSFFSPLFPSDALWSRQSLSWILHQAHSSVFPPIPLYGHVREESSGHTGLLGRTVGFLSVPVYFVSGI